MSTRRRLIGAGIGLGVLATLGTIAAAFPQDVKVSPRVQPDDPHDHDHGDEGGVGVELPPVQVPVPQGMDDAQREMVELFGRVERNLRKIDVLLSDAGAGDSEQLALVGEAGIGLLLNRSLESGRETIKDIDRILELAAEMGQQPQGGCPDCAAGT